ncbi:vacuolar ATPase assembly integral membrane protein vma21 [Coemansia sp. RSA 2711]|nr:vacuolar ATPase assembly integral membrane protein vma21 [Coemansia sp. RSA 2711]KAJ2383706.1 vacuolar ATPase assembly integral membrane protein vma21 [Coemansia sp. RSA 2611]
MPRAKKSRNAKNVEETELADISVSTARRRSRKDPTSSDSPHASANAERPTSGSAAQTPQIPSNVLQKLVAFSVVLLIAPILAYFLALHYVFAGSTTPAAITAAVTANIVLAAYVYAAWTEEEPSSADASERSAKRKTD